MSSANTCMHLLVLFSDAHWIFMALEQCIWSCYGGMCHPVLHSVSIMCHIGLDWNSFAEMNKINQVLHAQNLLASRIG